MFNFGIKTSQNFALISKLLRKMQKSYKQKKGAKFDYALFFTTNFQKYFANNFFCVHFFPIMSMDLKSA